MNRKKVRRIMKLKGWQARPLVRPKRCGGEPYDRREVVFDPKQKVAITLYNPERRHSRLASRTPVEFRERLRSEAA